MSKSPAIEIEGTIVPAVNRALNILEYISNNNGNVSLKEISNDLEIPSSSAFRLIKQLLARNYIIEITDKPGYYKLGLQLLSIAGTVIKSIDIHEIALPELQRLAQHTMQTVQLGILSGKQVMYIDQVSPPTSIIISTELYNTLPINISAIGKVIVAHMSEIEQNNFFKNAPLAKFTSKTITNFKELRLTFPDILKNGYSTDNEEFAMGIGCLAAPIFNYKHECVAGIGITGHIHDFHPKEKHNALVKRVIESANTISEKLGYSVHKKPIF